MKITRLENTKKVGLSMEGARGVTKQVPISAADGSPNYSFRVFTIEPGGHTPYHKHGFEHLNYILEGRGAIRTESGEDIEVKKGDFVTVLPNEQHQYRNVSTTHSFIMICAVPKEYE
jgi:quercetin dioxygenase-like cupin family protein